MNWPEIVIKIIVIVQWLQQNIFGFNQVCWWRQTADSWIDIEVKQMFVLDLICSHMQYNLAHRKFM